MLSLIFNNGEMFEHYYIFKGDLEIIREDSEKFYYRLLITDSFLEKYNSFREESGIDNLRLKGKKKYRKCTITNITPYDVPIDPKADWEDNIIFFSQSYIELCVDKKENKN